MERLAGIPRSAAVRFFCHLMIRSTETDMTDQHTPPMLTFWTSEGRPATRGKAVIDRRKPVFRSALVTIR